jgi:Predicted membrane protein
LQALNGSIHRTGPWTVPRRLEVEARHGNAVIDFTQAIITASGLDLTVSVRSGNLQLIVPPEVVVEVENVAVRSGNVRQRLRREPGTPVKLLITVSGSVRSGNVIVRGPRRAFKDWLFRRPLHPTQPSL